MELINLARRQNNVFHKPLPRTRGLLLLLLKLLRRVPFPPGARLSMYGAGEQTGP
jgi:hypothetical protein